MSQNRIIYQNWLVELGAEPEQIQKEGLTNLFSLEEMIEGNFDLSSEFQSERERAQLTELKEAVSTALKKLSEEEREFIIRFYFMGESYNDLSEKSHRSIHKLSALNKRATKKLQKYLAEFVQKRFGLVSPKNKDCPICQSEDCHQINDLIQQRDKTGTWRPLLKILREKYQLKIKSVQTVIGHEKYHI